MTLRGGFDRLAVCKDSFLWCWSQKAAPNSCDPQFILEGDDGHAFFDIGLQDQLEDSGWDDSTCAAQLGLVKQCNMKYDTVLQDLRKYVSETILDSDKMAFSNFLFHLHSKAVCLRALWSGRPEGPLKAMLAASVLKWPEEKIIFDGYKQMREQLAILSDHKAESGPF